MKTYLCIFTALIVFSLAQLNFSSHHQSDNPTDEVSFSSVLDLGEDGNIDNMTSSIADVKNRSEISSDEMDMYSPQTFFTTPQNMTFKTFSKDFLRRNIRGSTENDVLLLGFGGYCGAPPKLTTGYFEYYFKGTVIQINRENFTDGIDWQDPKNLSTIPKNQYHLGYVESGCQSLRIFYMAQFLLLQKELWDFFFQIEKKPVSSRDRFLIYTAGNCVDFRQSAFDAISLAKPSLTVEYAGGCHGNNNLPNIVKYDPHTGREFRNNWKFMREFRFCLVMENSYVEGYITEKILLAFAAGCIPIYYGTVEVFDIFNPKSFIYYDIENPKDALNEIARLYDEVMAEPILLEGNKTIQKYFSLSDEIIPNALLKKKIRDMVYFRCR